MKTTVDGWIGCLDRLHDPVLVDLCAEPVDISRETGGARALQVKGPGRQPFVGFTRVQ